MSKVHKALFVTYTKPRANSQTSADMYEMRNNRAHRRKFELNQSQGPVPVYDADSLKNVDVWTFPGIKKFNVTKLLAESEIDTFKEIISIPKQNYTNTTDFQKLKQQLINDFSPNRLVELLILYIKSCSLKGKNNLKVNLSPSTNKAFYDLTQMKGEQYCYIPQQALDKLHSKSNITSPPTKEKKSYLTFESSNKDNCKNIFQKNDSSKSPIKSGGNMFFVSKVEPPINEEKNSNKPDNSSNKLKNFEIQKGNRPSAFSQEQEIIDLSFSPLIPEVLNKKSIVEPNNLFREQDSDENSIYESSTNFVEKEKGQEFGEEEVDPPEDLSKTSNFSNLNQSFISKTKCTIDPNLMMSTFYKMMEMMQGHNHIPLKNKHLSSNGKKKIHLESLSPKITLLNSGNISRKRQREEELDHKHPIHKNCFEPSNSNIVSDSINTKPQNLQRPVMNSNMTFAEYYDSQSYSDIHEDKYDSTETKKLFDSFFYLNNHDRSKSEDFEEICHEIPKASQNSIFKTTQKKHVLAQDTTYDITAEEILSIFRGGAVTTDAITSLIGRIPPDTYRALENLFIKRIFTDTKIKKTLLDNSQETFKIIIGGYSWELLRVKK
jgi:hypothetical protein